jgi:hypothetical protein
MRLRLGLVVTVILAGAAWPAPAGAQQISMDQGVRAGELWCFPLASDPRQWVYLPHAAVLATNDAGKPQFSFLRYVANDASAAPGAATITAARGGGILHFLVKLETPEASRDAAQEFLRKSRKDDAIELRGPIIFSEGRFTLISSILSREGRTARTIMATGRAPVLEGNRLALSFDLEPEQATLLLESFKMTTPDVSLVFDMTFAGLADAYNARLTVDWSEVRKSEAFSAGGSIYFVGADVESTIDKLRRDNAIRLTTAGSDATMEGLLSTVYAKLLDLLFKPVQLDKVPQEKRGGLSDALAALTGPTGPLGSGKTTGFGAHAGYQMKEVQSSGLTVLDFNHRASVERHALITFNIGGLYKSHGANGDYFRAVNLEDPTFQQREVHVGIDGALLPEFDKFINNVTVTLRKIHGNGVQTLRELVLDRAAVERSGGDLRMVYGWNGEKDRTAWLAYDFRTRWSFKGGGSHETAWRSADSPMLDLFAPYERRLIRLSGDSSQLTSKGIRAAVVQVAYPFFGTPRRQQVVVKPGQELDGLGFEITLPRDQYEYDYSVVWQFAGGERRAINRRDGSGLIFVDEIPGPSGPEGTAVLGPPYSVKEERQ